MFEGGCFCGRIRYRAGGVPFNETTCHCTDCRRTTGAPFVTWFSVSRPGFRITSGEPTRFRSSAKATRSFCPDCGTQLIYEHDDFADEIGITTASLDDPNTCPPRDHTFVRSRLRWIALADGLPEYATERTAP